MNNRKNISSVFRENKSLLVLAFYLFIALIGFLINSESLASATDIKNIYKAPFENADYLLGTDQLGRSVFYGLINGAKVSLSIALSTTAISLFIGLFIAFLAAYYGDTKLKLNWYTLILFVILTVLCLFYFIYSDSKSIWVSLWLLLTWILFKIDSKLPISERQFNIPMDSIILKLLEIFKTMPGIFIILFFLALFTSWSVWNLVLLITFIRIPIVVRLARSEILKIKNQDFILAAEGMGISAINLLFRHIVPNIIAPIRTLLVYGLASTILIESVLSFLGLGLPLETVTWGSMLSSSRDYFSAWWLAIFPGFAIFLLIYSLRHYFIKRVEDQEYFFL